MSKSSPIQHSSPGNQSNHRKRSFIEMSLSSIRYEHLVAGVFGGVSSTLMLHPLDLIKIRFAVSDGRDLTTRPQYSGLTNAFRSILKNDGVFGLYRGVTPNATGAGLSWGLYFLFYGSIKAWMLGDSKTTLDPGRHMLAASEAGILTLVLTNPIWVVKTRLCLQYEKGFDMNSPKSYRGMVDALVKVYKYEGIHGMYRGFVPGLLGVSHGALQFMAYEELKKAYNGWRNVPLDSKFSTIEYLSMAAISKLFAAVITYPYQVIRARLQDQHSKYTGVVDVCKQTWRYEGAGGFYKGLVPNLIRVVPATSITFVVYESTMKYLARRHEQHDA